MLSRPWGVHPDSLVVPALSNFLPGSKMPASEEADDLALRLYDNCASTARRRRSTEIHLKSGGRGCFRLVACNTKIPQRWNTPEADLYSLDANLVSAYKARFPGRVKSTPESLCFLIIKAFLPPLPHALSKIHSHSMLLVFLFTFVNICLPN